MSLTTIKISHVPEVVDHLPPSVAVMLRGESGIGKSSVARLINKRLCERTGVDRPLIDRRLSQMQGGDLMGLPSVEGNTTRWNPPDWYKQACLQPCDLLLDEVNRAEQDVTNGFFQIALDRELNGHRLHPETRIYTGVNLGALYNVHPIDPALLRRFWVGDLTTSVEEWSEWARSEGLNRDYVSWLEKDEQFFQVTGEYDASAVQPSPRSHELCARAIGPLLDMEHQPRDLIRRIAQGFIGAEAALKLNEYLVTEFHFDGFDLLNEYKGIKHRIKMHRIDVQRSALEKVVDALKEHEVLGTLLANPDGPSTRRVARDTVQGENLEEFLYDINAELRPMLFVKLAKLGVDRVELIKSAHPYFYKPILAGIGVPPGAAGIGVMPNMAGLENMVQQSKQV